MTYDPLKPPPEPPEGTWVKDRHGALSRRTAVTVNNGLRLTGWGPPGMEPFGKWEAMWRARGPLVECGPDGEDLPGSEEPTAPADPAVVIPKVLAASMGYVAGLHKQLGLIEHLLTPDDQRDVDSARVFLEAVNWKLEGVLARQPDLDKERG